MKGDDDERSEDEQVEDANAKGAEAANKAENIIGDVTAWHLKIEDVTIGDAAFALHEECFVEERRFVMRDGPAQGIRRLYDEQDGE